MLIFKPETDFEPIRKAPVASFVNKVIMAAIELKVFDFLVGKGMTSFDLAKRLELVADRLEPVLDVLVAARLLVRTEGVYANTPVANEYLVSTAPLYQADGMRLITSFYTKVEDSILDLLAGKDAQVQSMKGDWSTMDAIEGTAQNAMSGGLSAVVDYIGRLPDFTGFTSMCDIGGNHGMYTLGVLEQNPEMKGVIYDLPGVLPLAQSRCEKLGFGERISTIEFDLKEDRLPESQYDVVVMSHILYVMKHDLSSVIERIAETLKPGGWFVSHHYAQNEMYEDLLSHVALEAMTRLSGYPSHVIEKEGLTDVLSRHGFTAVRSERVAENQMGLIVAAQIEK
ncbi:acetylserotonin O-methyltransferase [Pseudodesulfovibrio sediminis]|uniref:Uncharacterized protein n=1 Tax=Pseudodesulfovibrio sediminis TaxID=2810563 RepID=A0ABM7P512_9BACT|nr:acetylserotonin O-methyltransferase [Pseudodesulfovibrio sediminis]BCS87958.1 hypothetical protein PSDVSF_12000 [Pseudodesulfovibrio sediminis]